MGDNLDETSENNVHRSRSGQTPGESGSGFAIAIFKASCVKNVLKKKVISDTSTKTLPAFQNDKHLYFI